MEKLRALEKIDFLQNRPATAIALHFLCMHDSGHTHQVKHRILRMQVCIGHMRSSCICTRKASWGEQGVSSRRVHTTLLIRTELPGRIGIGDHGRLGTL